MTEVTRPGTLPTRFLFRASPLLRIAPGIVIVSAIASATPFDPIFFLVWLGVHSVTLAIAGGVAWAVSEALLATRRSHIGMGWVVATGALAGAVKSVTTSAASVWWGLANWSGEDFALRLVGGVVVGVWFIALFAYGAAALHRLDRARSALVARHVATRLAEESIVARPEVSRSLMAVEKLRESLAHPDRPLSSSAIRQVVDSTIRPLSRALWAAEEKRYPPLTLNAMYRIALQSLKIRAGVIAAVWSVTSFASLAATLSPFPAATYSGMTGLVAFVLFLVVRLGWTRSIYVSVAVVAAVSVISVGAGFALASVVTPSLTSADMLAVLAAGVVWMTFVAIGASVFSGVTHLRAVIQSDLDSEPTKKLIVEKSQAGAEKTTTRLLAAELHGSVQSALIGIAAALDRNTLSREEADRLLGDVVSDLETLRLHDGYPSGHRSSPGDTLGQLVERWSDVMDITIDDSSLTALLDHTSRHPEVLEVIREGLTNAYRHGSATALTISAKQDQSGLMQLSIADNGYGPRQGSPGLGSALLDRWTGQSWALTARPDGGSVLTATLRGDG